MTHDASNVLFAIFGFCAAGGALATACETLQNGQQCNLELDTEVVHLDAILEEAQPTELFAPERSEAVEAKAATCECDAFVKFTVEYLDHAVVTEANYLKWDVAKGVRRAIAECDVDPFKKVYLFNTVVTFKASSKGVDGIARIPCGPGVSTERISQVLLQKKACFEDRLDQQIKLMLQGFRREMEMTSNKGISVPTFSVSLCEEQPTIRDTHIGNMDNESFNVNQPGTHVFVRIPQNREEPALLEMNAMIQSAGGLNPCAMHITEASLSGKWMGNASGLRIRASPRPLQHYPAIQINATSEWVPCVEFPKIPMVLSEELEGLYGKATLGADAWNDGFTLRFGAAAINIKHSKPDVKMFLNVRVKHVTAIPFKVGGLLGTGERDSKVEELTEICEAFVKSGRNSKVTSATNDVDSASTASVTWE